MVALPALSWAIAYLPDVPPLEPSICTECRTNFWPWRCNERLHVVSGWCMFGE